MVVTEEESEGLLYISVHVRSVAICHIVQEHADDTAIVHSTHYILYNDKSCIIGSCFLVFQTYSTTNLLHRNKKNSL